MQHLEEGQIHAWLDGELSVVDAAAVAAHIDQCAECAARVREARGLAAAASRIVDATDWGVGAAPSSDTLPAFVREGTRPRTMRRNRWSRWTISAGSIAAVLAIVALGTGLFHRERTQNMRPMAAAVRQPTQVAAAPAPPAAAPIPPSERPTPRTGIASTGSSGGGGARDKLLPIPPTPPATVPASPGAPTFASPAAGAQPVERAAPMAAMQLTRRSAANGAAAKAVRADAAIAPSPLMRCYAVSPGGDSLPAAIPQRFVLQPGGVVRSPAADTLLSNLSWQRTSTGALVFLDSSRADTLRLTSLGDSVRAELATNGRVVAVRVGRCESSR